MSPPSQQAALLELQFQERIARAKEAARMASLAVASRSHSREQQQQQQQQSPYGQTPPAGFSAPRGALPPAPGVPYHSAPVPRGPTQSAAPAPPMTADAIPPTVQHRIDRLVEFVARNGPAFEATARQRERHNPDFAFLTPGAPFHDYYEWKKQQACGPNMRAAFEAPAAVAAQPVQGRPQAPAQSAAPSPPGDLLSDLSAGALANVCKLARVRGVPAYAPIPREVVLGVGSLPPVEPARLEIRLAEFYRDADTEVNTRPQDQQRVSASSY